MSYVSIAGLSIPFTFSAGIEADIAKATAAKATASPTKMATAYNPFDDEEEVVKAPVVEPVSAPVAGPKKKYYSTIGSGRPFTLPKEATLETVRSFITIPPESATLETLRQFARDHDICRSGKEAKTKAMLRAFIEKQLDSPTVLAWIYSKHRAE